MKLYLIRCGRRELGSVSLSNLLDGLSLGHIPFYSNVFCEDSEQWIPFAQHSEIAPAVIKLLKMPLRTVSEKSLLGHWFVRREEQNFGPFPLVQMIELYQQNNITCETLVRHPNHDSWKSFTAVPPFDDQSIKALFMYPQLKNIFTQRKSPRVQYDNEVCVSSAGFLYTGVSLSLSKRGIGILLSESTHMKVNDKLNLIINPNSEHGTIQSKCEVVSFHRTNGRDKLGLVFDQEIEPLTEYIERRVPLL